jgi:hypothetical protein
LERRIAWNEEVKQTFEEHYGVLLRETVAANFDQDVAREVQL